MDNLGVFEFSRQNELTQGYTIIDPPTFALSVASKFYLPPGGIALGPEGPEPLAVLSPIGP